MSVVLDIITQRENDLIRSFGGLHCIPEANDSMNDLQREKINAIYIEHGKAYIGKINFYDKERVDLNVDTIFVEYTGQMVHNFMAGFTVPCIDITLAEMIIQWNAGGPPVNLKLIKQITNRIKDIGGINLMWS